jgi:hypothetical protein
VVVMYSYRLQANVYKCFFFTGEIAGGLGTVAFGLWIFMTARSEIQRPRRLYCFETVA